ncbi:hypothetical protein I350_04096 [Cryptococcus amylolentus CBS 6273]|uniref:E3 ubiquitin-protein ligase listerin n=1 Tax=Cryptococcus amylolentus CBS 6273 TaxID=1296118 RepID=A0A1E3K2P3_9TREE|nr:hypothetical protein I350_04096 [Cryptococcus amylolentus CBS 6273]
MAPSKSSASAGTRKKNAAKKARKNGEDPEDMPPPPPNTRKQRGEKKLSKAQRKALPKVKQYIPPPKPPAPPIPDPLDGQGLARTLPAELVVVLRRLGKKDDVTRRKGLEEFRDDWVRDVTAAKGSEEEEVDREVKEIAILSAIPVWLHNLASLLQSPFQRSTALAIQSDLLSVPALRSSILESINLGFLPGTQNRDVLGSWMVAALEEGRRSGGAAIKSWEASTTWKSTGEEDERIDISQQLAALVEYLTLSTVDPVTLHDNIQSAPVFSESASQAPTPKKNPNKAAKTKTPAPISRQVATPVQAEDEEVVEERLVRYRVGGLVGLTSLLQSWTQLGSLELPADLISLLRNPGLWIALSPEIIDKAENPGALGTAQPPIRRAAYSLLSVLITSFEKIIGEPEVLKMVSDAVLGGCWVEKEAAVWEAAGPAVAKFVRKWPECWIITAIDQPAKDEENSGDEAASENEQDVPTAKPEGPPVSPHYTSFLDFASTICPSIPGLTYPIILVVLSTLPISLLSLASPSSQLQTLFSHLWSPVDARLLSTHSLPGQQSAFQMFLQAFLESTIFLIGKSWRLEDGEGKDAAAWLAREQLGERAWKEGVLVLGGKGGGRRVAQGKTNEAEARLFGSTLARLVAIDEQLLEAVKSIASQALLDGCFPSTEQETKPIVSVLPRALSILSAVKGSTEDAKVAGFAEDIIRNIVQQSAELLGGDDKNPGSVVVSEALVLALSEYPHLVDDTVVHNLVDLFHTSSTSLLQVLTPPLYVRTLDLLSKVSSSPEEKATCQKTLVSLLSSQEAEASQRFVVASSLLSLSSTNLLQPTSLDPIVTEATHEALSSGSPEAVSVITASLRSLSHISPATLHNVLSKTCKAIQSSTDKLLTTDFTELGIPRAAFEIFTVYAQDHLKEVVGSDEWVQGLVAIHHVLFMLPRVPGHIETREGKMESLTNVWAKLGELEEKEQSKVLVRVHEALREEIGRVGVHVSPDVLVDVALATTLGGRSSSVGDLADALLPHAEQLLKDLASHASRSPHPTLPLVDALIPFVAPDEDADIDSTDFDLLGRSEVSRYAEAAVALLRANRSLVKTEPVLLQVALAVGRIAQDALAVPGASRGLFSKDTPLTRLEDLVREVEGATSFALGYVDEVPSSWHAATVQALKSDTLPEGSDLLQRLLTALKRDVVATGGDVSARSFRDVLSRHLRQVGAGEKEGEAWLAYAMGQVDRAPQLALAIILAIKPMLLDTQPFMTAQNRLASAITTIPPSKCHTALDLLRIFNASAPPPDSASVFLPQQRALFALRHVAGWLTSDDVDEDQLPEDMEYRVLELEGAVAPIVQDVGGNHWDGIFDLVESGLENSAMDDPASLCLMYQSLSVLQQIRNLCQTNKSLRASWTSKDAHLKLVLDLFLQCRLADTAPLQEIQALILDLLPDIPDKVMEHASLSSLSKLVSLSTSSAIQTAAYRILSKVIKHETLSLVLEVEASLSDEDGHKERTIELAKELVDIVKIGTELDWHGELGVPLVLGQLLTWMSILDYFEDASRTLRWAYLDQLNTSNLITDGLIPMLFAILGVSEVGAWNFPASQYAVDEYFTEFLDPESLPDLAPLASHIFYRALVTIPSSLRGYYESLKDRQLSMSMLNFTARHFSPVIIAHEFSALRQPAAMAQLTEEGLNVRIAQGSSEAIASYVVDEQPMEIGIRLPAEFPLKAVDVRDLRRVGVPENKWRGWLMSVQQTITSRNGLILEALTLFKRNVSLHFEGVVECAICYSIISLTDRTLPTKPCRTCKNRFHASCLFKWFNSSHSSSCPLCRSLF